MRAVVLREKHILIIKLGCFALFIIILFGISNHVLYPDASENEFHVVKIPPELHLLGLEATAAAHTTSKIFTARPRIQTNRSNIVGRNKLQIPPPLHPISEHLNLKDKNGIFDNPNISQNDTRILNYLIKHRLHPPPSPPYDNMRHQVLKDPSDLALQLFLIFGTKKNGVFIEAGANDGVFLSNTLFLERNLGWSGLLVEANKIIFPELQRARRNSWIVNVCLAVKPFPHKVNILHRVGQPEWYKGNGLIEANSDVPPVKYYEESRQEFISAGLTECFPLFSLLSAINMFHVDYFSLDVQGVELKILKTIPFDSVDIKVISVEHDIVPEGKEAIRSFLISKGYHTVLESASEFIFIKKGYVMAGKLANTILKTMGSLNLDN